MSGAPGYRVRAFNFETRGPGDVSGLTGLLERGEVRAEDVVCVLGKTEGNGGRNDFTRDLAMGALERLIGSRLGVPPESVQDRVVFSFSGGTEGVVTPHMIVFVREGALPKDAAARRAEKRLSVAVGATREFEPGEIGRMPQIEETARAVRALVEELGVDDARDVHLIQMKGAIPSFTHAEAEAAARAGTPLRCDMAYSRGASALGVALALGEVQPEALSDEVVLSDYRHYSAIASCSAKPGLRRTELLAFANSAYAEGELQIGHGVLTDLLDVAGIHAVARGLGLQLGAPPDPAEVKRIVGVFAKSEADARGTVRGRRHTMLSDDDISDTRYSRCVLSSVLAATLGDTRVYVSTRAEHHGPQGGGPLAMIVRAR
jgi:cyanuric acid amidohydrolase